MAEKLLKIATVTAAHGIRGEVRIKVFLEDTRAFAHLAPFYDAAGRDLGALEIRGQSKGQLIVQMADTNSRDAAQAIQGLNLFIPRDRLPEPEDEDEFYYTDLIGLKVFEAGENIGVVKSLRDYGAGDFVEIRFSDGTQDYFSFTRDIFPEINLADGWIALIRPTQTLSQDETGKAH